MKQCDTIYLITLAGTLDDMPVAVFDTRAGVDAFIRTNRPCPVDGYDAIREGPLATALEAAGRGPSIVLGYQVWEFKDGVPVRGFNRRWTDDRWPGVREWVGLTEAEQHAFEEGVEDDPWLGDYPAARTGRWKATTSPQEEWRTNDGDNTGGGPVG